METHTAGSVVSSRTSPPHTRRRTLTHLHRSMKRMIHSLSLHQLVIFSATTLLMLLVILRLGFATVLLLRRAHAYANECPGAEASRRRELRPREEEGGGLPAYSVVEDGDEKNALLPAYEERS